MMISVTDLKNYNRCKRRLWLDKKGGVEIPNTGFSTGRRFHSVVHDLFKQVESAWAREGVPRKVVHTELSLSYENLRGRVDFLREGSEGFIIHDEKFFEPPETGDVYPSHELQANAYGWLAENSGFQPISKLFVIYHDMVPREIKPDFGSIPPLLSTVESFLEGTDSLPPTEGNCKSCHYYSLCQILPEAGGISSSDLKALRKIETEAEFLKQMEKTVEIKENQEGKRHENY